LIAFSRPVSIVALRGGFGNQLFTWAYGQELVRDGHFVLYDRGDGLGRGFALEGLIPKSRLIHLPTVAWRKIAGIGSTSILRNRSFLKVEDQSLPPDLENRDTRFVSLHWGYWQSMDYFSQSKDNVFEKVVRWLAVALDGAAETCAIHVRRGDYVSDPSAAAVMGTLSLSYYKRAILLMKQRGFADFVVYSDDRTWAIANILPLDDAIRIAETADDEDFNRMAGSGGLITANSSFSWWAAFVVSMSGGQVVAPRDWFADSTLNSSRIVPNTWTAV